MLEISNVLMKSIGIYLFVCYGLYHIEHPKMFKEDRSFREFGLGDNQTLLSFWIVTTLVGISSYYLLLVQEGNYVRD
tara:strand:- start:285 stop:515 length:231 start_codon:yes stop_codon:yes gene_type:complete